jgi:hypothetical protein
MESLENPSAHRRFVAWRYGMWAGVAVGMVLAFQCKPLLGSWGELAVHMALPACLLAAAAIFAGYRALKNGPRARPWLVEMLKGSPVIVLAAGGLLAFINEKADTSETRVYATRVLEVGAPRHRGISLFERKAPVGFQSWHGAGIEEIRVPKSQPVAVGDRWVVRVRAGALGYPWVEDMRPRK